MTVKRREKLEFVWHWCWVCGPCVRCPKCGASTCNPEEGCVLCPLTDQFARVAYKGKQQPSKKELWAKMSSKELKWHTAWDKSRKACSVDLEAITFAAPAIRRRARPGRKGQ